MAKNSPYKVKVTIGDALVEIEGAESGVVKIVEALSETLRGSAKVGKTDQLRGLPQQVPPAQHTVASTDIRSFFEIKKPATDVEAAAVVAYYYKYVAQESERLETINARVLQDAFRLGKRPLPKVVRYTLQNARNAGYLDTTAEAGEFRLNAVGYNLVEHTLGQSKDTGKEVRTHRRRRKR